MATKKKHSKKRAKSSKTSRKPSGLKLPRELWTMSDEQIKDTVAYLAKLPESEIRKRQDLNVSAGRKAYEAVPERNRKVGHELSSEDHRVRALGNVQSMEILLQAAMLKKDGAEPIVSFARLRSIYGGVKSTDAKGPSLDAHIIRSPELNKFLGAYITAALWSSNDNADDSGGQPLDANYSRDDLTPECLNRMVTDCEKFVRENKAALNWATESGKGYDWEQAGHDFWLTRNRHGAGFWDRDNLSESLQKKLTDAAHAFGETYLSVDDGKIYCD